MVRLATLLLTGFLAVALNALSPSGEISDSLIVDDFNNDGTILYPPGSLDSAGEDVTDQPIVWGVKGSRYRTEGYPRIVYVDKKWPFSLYGIEPENSEELKVLGVRGKFDKLGYNSISIMPGVGEGENWQAVTLPLSSINKPVIVRSFSVWLWGAGLNYDISIVVQDFRGFLHVLPLVHEKKDKTLSAKGNLSYRGWQRLAATVPKTIPQGSFFNTQETRLKFVKFLINTAPDERVDDFFLYIDHLKMQIGDLDREFYDGFELSRKSVVDSIWNEDVPQGAANEVTNE